MLSQVRALPPRWQRFLMILTLQAGLISCGSRAWAQATFTPANQQTVSQWWDALWSTFLTPQNPVWGVYLAGAQIVLVIAAAYYLVGISRDSIHTDQLPQLFQRLIPLLLALILLAQNGAVGLQLAKAVRDVAFGFNRQILQLQVAQQSLGSAWTDMRVLGATKAQLRDELQQCQLAGAAAVVLPNGIDTNPADPNLTSEQRAYANTLACYRNVARLAREAQVEANQNCRTGLFGTVLRGNYDPVLNPLDGLCSATQSFLADLTGRIDQNLQTEAVKAGGGIVREQALNRGLQDLLGGFVVETVMTTLLGWMSWLYAFLVQGGFFLAALSLPIVAAMSLFPHSQVNALLGWGLMVLNGSISLWAYTLIAGFANAAIRSSGAYSMDSLAAFVMGFGAPALSLALFSAGGFAAFRAATSATVGSAVSLAASTAIFRR